MAAAVRVPAVPLPPPAAPINRSSDDAHSHKFVGVDAAFKATVILHRLPEINEEIGLFLFFFIFLLLQLKISRFAALPVTENVYRHDSLSLNCWNIITQVCLLYL